MPQRRRGYSRRRARRPMFWTHILTDPAAVAAGGQASVDLLQQCRIETLVNLMSGAVIKRVVGNVYARPTDASSESEGSFGLIYTEEDAEAASTVADPFDDRQAKWRWWKRFILGTQATGELGRGAFKDFELDLKMNVRINKPGDAFNLVAESDDGTQGFVFAVGLRVFIQR